MSIKEKKLSKIALHFKKQHKKGTGLSLIKKKLWILYHEIIRDDVTIRAESLSYFTLFSIMPIIAGLFLAVGAVSQWAPIQESFQQLIQHILEPLPVDHRKSLMQFILQFKDEYLQKITSKGSTIGFFAVFILIGIIGKVYLNLEDLMNRIWSAHENRPWIERFRNLVLTMVILPFSIFTALSLPGLVEKFGGVKLGLFVEKGVPALLLFGTLFFLFRYFPNVDVKSKNATKGAALSSVLFFISNSVLSVYFKFGTQTAYGKAAAIPLAAFFIYVSWIIIMVGAEWSFVLQNEASFTDTVFEHPNLQEASLLLKVIETCKRRHEEGKQPASENELCRQLGVSSRSLLKVTDFLIQQGTLISSIRHEKGGSETVYLFPFAPDRIDLVKTIENFLEIGSKDQKFDVNQVIQMISTK